MQCKKKKVKKYAKGGYMKNPCQDGYVAYGLKTKNGKKVPACVPKKK